MYDYCKSSIEFFKKGNFTERRQRGRTCKTDGVKYAADDYFSESFHSGYSINICISKRGHEQTQDEK